MLDGEHLLVPHRQRELDDPKGNALGLLAYQPGHGRRHMHHAEGVCNESPHLCLGQPAQLHLKSRSLAEHAPATVPRWSPLDLSLDLAQLRVLVLLLDGTHSEQHHHWLELDQREPKQPPRGRVHVVHVLEHKRRVGAPELGGEHEQHHTASRLLARLVVECTVR